MQTRFLVPKEFWESTQKDFDKVVKCFDIKVIVYGHDNYQKLLIAELDNIELDTTKAGNTKNKILFVSERIGVFAFNMACKRKKIVCAAVENEHSALMTRLHNNANVVVFNWFALAPRGIAESMNVFLSSKFEGGRHNARLEMLEKEVV